MKKPVASAHIALASVAGSAGVAAADSHCNHFNLVAALLFFAASAVACGGAGTPATDHHSEAALVPKCPNPGSCYVDNDYDGIGAGSLVQSCGCGTPGWSYVTGDCDDGDAAKWQLLPCYTDSDGDHYGTGTSHNVCTGASCGSGATQQAESAGDCNDADASIHPHRLEVAQNGVDDD